MARPRSCTVTRICTMTAIAASAPSAGTVGSYDGEVVVSGDVRAALLDTVARFDTVCVGATGERLIARALYGSIPREIVDRAAGMVVMARDAEPYSLTLRQALAARLEALLEAR